MFNRLKLDAFVVAIIISIIIAYFFPQLGASSSPVNLDRISSIGISLIFFFYGLSLDNTAIKNGLKNWKLHVSVQASTFFIFPAVILLFYPFIKGTSYELLWLSFLFMVVLPSTVSFFLLLVCLS